MVMWPILDATVVELVDSELASFSRNVVGELALVLVLVHVHAFGNLLELRPGELVESLYELAVVFISLRRVVGFWMM